MEQTRLPPAARVRAPAIPSCGIAKRPPQRSPLAWNKPVSRPGLAGAGRPVARGAGRRPEEAGAPEIYAPGGSQGSVPMSAGRLTSTSSKVSEVAISLWGTPPGIYMLSPGSIRTTLPPANSRSTQPSSM